MAAILAASITNTTYGGVSLSDSPINFMLNVANTGNSTTNVTAIQPVVVNIATGGVTNAVIPPVTLTPEANSAVLSTSNTNFPFQLLIPQPSSPGGTGNANRGLYTVYAVVTTSDGAVTTSPGITLAITPTNVAQQSALPSNGQLVFDNPLSSALWFFFA